MKGEANVNIIHKGLSKILNFLSLLIFPAPLCFNTTLNICAFSVTNKYYQCNIILSQRHKDQKVAQRKPIHKILLRPWLESGSTWY